MTTSIGWMLFLVAFAVIVALLTLPETYRRARHRWTGGFWIGLWDDRSGTFGFFPTGGTGPIASLASLTNADNLQTVPVATLPDGTVVWVVGEQEFYRLDRNSGAALASPAVVSAFGGPPNARWFRMNTGTNPVLLRPTGGNDAPMINAVAVLGLPMQAQPGAWNIDSTVNLIDGFSLTFLPGGSITINIPGATTASSAFVSAEPGPRSGITTLAAPPTAQPSQITLTSAVGWAVNRFCVLVKASGITAYYAVDALVGAVASISRDPTIWPFTTGDTAALIGGKPPTFYLDLGNVPISGTFVLVVFAPCALKSIVKNIVINAGGATGANADAIAGFHTGSLECTLENVTADLTGSVCIVGCGFVGVERCNGKKILVTNGPSAIGFRFSDDRYSTLDATSGASGNAGGAAFGSDFGITTDACVGSKIEGGAWTGNTARGIVIGGCRDLLIEDVTCNDNGNQGIFVDASVNTGIFGAVCRRNGSAANPGQILIDTTCTGTKMDAITLESIATGPNAPDLLIEGDCDIGTLQMICRTNTTAFLLVSAAATAIVKIQNLKMLSQTSGTGNYAVRCDAGELYIDQADVTLGTASDVTISTQSANAKIKVRAIRALNPGAVATTFGYYAHGGYMSVGRDSDVSACATDALIDNGGTLLGDFEGTGSPAGARVASPGSTYCNLSGGAGTSFFVKEANTTSAGWVGK